MAISFFNPAEAEASAIVEALGAGWDIQTCSLSVSRERAAALGSDGDESASKLYGAKDTLTINAKANTENGTAFATIPAVGTVLGSYHIDSVTLTYSATDWPALDITAHKHESGTSHSTVHRTYDFPAEVKSTLLDGFGIPAGLLGITLSDAGSGFSGVTLALTANHVEAPMVGADAAVPASDNHDGTLTVTLNIVGSGTLNGATGWDQTENSHNQSNSGNDDSTVTLVKHLAHTVVGP